VGLDEAVDDAEGVALDDAELLGVGDPMGDAELLGVGDPVGDAELLGVGDPVGDAELLGVGDGDHMDGVIGRIGDVAAGAKAVTGVDGVTGWCDDEGGRLDEGAGVTLVPTGLALGLSECL
jgi:hypothetical protein